MYRQIGETLPIQRMAAAETGQDQLIAEETNERRQALKPVNDCDFPVRGFCNVKDGKRYAHEATFYEFGLLGGLPHEITLEIGVQEKAPALYPLDHFGDRARFGTDHDVIERIHVLVDVRERIAKAFDFLFDPGLAWGHDPSAQW